MKTKWKQLGKKLLSGALALAMMCSILPASAITAAAASTGTVNIYVKKDGATTFIKSYSYTQSYANDGFTIPTASAAGVSSYGTVDYVEYNGSGYSSVSGGTKQPGGYISISGNFSGMTLWYVMKDSVTYYSHYLYYNDNVSSATIAVPSTQSYTNTTATSHSFTISSYTPTRTGYTFDGWYTNSSCTGTKYTAGSTISVSGSITLYAKWVQDVTYYSYSLSYSDNVVGESISVPSTQTASNQTTTAYTFTISSTTPSRTGYKFLGWSESSTATDASYQPGGSYTVYSSSPTKTLYAVWGVDSNNNGTLDKDETYTVSYNTDGGTPAIASVDYLQGATVTVSTATVSKENYLFQGWSYHGATYQAGDTSLTMPESNVEFKAVWVEDFNNNEEDDSTEEHYTITYKDGVNETVFADDVHANVLVDTITPAFTGSTERAGYIFAGWNDDNTGKVTGDATYTAQWKVDSNNDNVADEEQHKYTLSYDENTTDAVDGLPNASTSDFISGDWVTTVSDATPTRENYLFAGWNTQAAGEGTPYAVSQSITVSADTILYAQWAEDFNGNKIDDATETKYIVIYTDGVEDEVFADENHADNLVGNATPAFKGSTTREGYVFVEWTPEVAENIDANNATEIAGQMVIRYTAVWQKAAPNVSATDCTTEDNNDGTITGTDTTMEYRKVAEDGEEENDWIAITEDGVTGLIPGDYEVRYAEGTEDASASTIVTVGEYVAPTDDDDDDDDSTGTTTTTTTTTVTTVDVVDTATTEEVAATVSAATTATTTTTIEEPEKDEVEEPVEEPATEIEADEVPLADQESAEIEEEEVPLVATASSASWALVNLFLAIGTAAASIVMLIGYFLGRRDDEEGEGNRSVSRLLSILPALLGAVCFIMTQNMANSMAFVDKWTLAMVLIALIQVGVALKARKDEGEQEDSTFA